jgi:hypothetical protein
VSASAPSRTGLHPALTVELRLDFGKRIDALLASGFRAPLLLGGFVIEAPAAEFDGRPFEPTLGLPRDVKIGGRPAPADRVTAGVGESPQVSFEAPSLGAPTSYFVRVIDLDDVRDAAGDFVINDRPVAFFATRAHSVNVPAGALRAGRHYCVRVTAEVRDGGDSTSPFALPVRKVSATTYSGVFTP